MTDQTEAEVEAAVKITGLAPEIARAALTAAAQVREREEGKKASLVQATTEPAEASRDHPTSQPFDAIEKLIRAIGLVKSFYSSGFDPEGQRYATEYANKAIAEGRIVQAATIIPLMPIYSATEATEDYGPDVLGERKE